MKVGRLTTVKTGGSAYVGIQRPLAEHGTAAGMVVMLPRKKDKKLVPASPFKGACASLLYPYPSVEEGQCARRKGLFVKPPPPRSSLCGCWWLNKNAFKILIIIYLSLLLSLLPFLRLHLSLTTLTLVLHHSLTLTPVLHLSLTLTLVLHLSWWSKVKLSLQKRWRCLKRRYRRDGVTQKE